MNKDTREKLTVLYERWKDFIIFGISWILITTGIFCINCMIKVQSNRNTGIRYVHETDKNDSDGNFSMIIFGILATFFLSSGCWLCSWFWLRCKVEFKDAARASSPGGPDLCPGGII